MPFTFTLRTSSLRILQFSFAEFPRNWPLYNLISIWISQLYKVIIEYFKRIDLYRLKHFGFIKKTRNEKLYSNHQFLSDTLISKCQLVFHANLSKSIKLDIAKLIL